LEYLALKMAALWSFYVLGTTVTQQSVASHETCLFSNFAVTTGNLTMHLHVHVNVLHLFWTELHHFFNVHTFAIALSVQH
jgi:hypothetical protein